MEALPIQARLYIHYITNSFLDNKYLVSTCDMSQNYPDQYVLLETRDITLTIGQPDAFDIIDRQVNQLRNQKEELAAESHRQQALLDDKIQQLLCIDHCPIPESDIPF